MFVAPWRCVVIALLWTASSALAADDKPADAPVDAAAKKLLAGTGFYQAGRYAFAIQEFEEYLKLYPNNADATTARFRLGMSYYNTSKWPDAVTHLTKVAETKYESRDLALAALGLSHQRQQEHEKALMAFDDLLKNHPNSKQVEPITLNRVNVLYQLGKRNEAVDAAKVFVEKYPKSTNYTLGLYTLGFLQNKSGKLADAEKTFAKLLTDAPQSPYAIDAMLLLGETQEAQNKLDDAAGTFKSMIDRAPASRQAEAHYRHAIVLHNLGKFDAAIKSLETVRKDFEKSPFAARAHLQLGKTQYQAGRYADARKTLEAVAKNDKDSAAEANFWLAQCDIADRKYDPALKTLDALAALDPKPANIEEIDFFRAVCEMQLELYDTASKAFDAFRAKYGKSKYAVEATFHHAFCLHKLEKFDASSKLCEQIVAAKAAPYDYRAEKLWAENLFMSRQYEPATQKFARLAGIATSDDDKLQIEVRLAQAAHYTGDYKKAADLLGALSARDAVAKQPEYRRVVFLHGDALLQTGANKQAADAITRYLKLVPGDEEARYKLGLAQRRAGDDDAAIASYSMVMTGPANSTWVQHASLAYGQITYNRKQPDKAAPALRKVVDAKAPADVAAPAAYLLARIAYEAKKHDEAAAAFTDVAKRYPGHELAIDSAFLRGLALNDAGKTEEALAALEAFVKANPKAKQAPQARQAIASTLSKLGRNDEAARMLAALAADKEGRNDVLLYDLAWSQRSLKNNDGAVQSYQQLISEFPQSRLITHARVELADLLYAKEQYKDAAGLLEQALANKSTDAKTIAAARYRLGWSYAKVDEHAKAADAFTSFAAANPKDPLAPAALYQAGVALRATGKPAEAQQQFSALLKNHPEDELAPTALLRLAETQSEAGDFAKAIKTYQQFLDNHEKSEFAHLALFGIGWANEQQKQYDAARTWYAKTIERTNTETAARAQFQIGETYFIQKNYEQAAKELLKVEIVYAYPQWSAKALYEAGQAFEQLGQADEARGQYNRCVEKYAKESAAELAKRRLEAMKDAG